LQSSNRDDISLTFAEAAHLAIGQIESARWDESPVDIQPAATGREHIRTTDVLSLHFSNVGRSLLTLCWLREAAG
jgi:hypothetical protein